MKRHLLSLLTVLFFTLTATAGGEPKVAAGPGDKNPTIKSYPNPVGVELFVEVQLLTPNQFSRVEVKIVNLLGQEIIPTFKADLDGLNNNFKIDMRDVPNGIYFMEVTTTAADGNSYTHSKKVTKI